LRSLQVAAQDQLTAEVNGIVARTRLAELQNMDEQSSSDLTKPGLIAYDGKGYSDLKVQRRLIFVLVIMSALATLDRGIISLLIRPIKSTLGLSDVQVSLVIGAAFAISATIAAVPAGWAVDRYNRKFLLGGAAFVWSGMTALCGLSANFIQLFFARAGLGMSEALVQPGSFSLIRDTIPPARRGRAFSAYYISTMLGTSSSFLIGGLLLGAVERWGVDRLPFIGPLEPWQLTMLLVSLAGIPVILLVMAIEEPKRHREDHAPLPQTSYRDAGAFILTHKRLFAPIFVAQASFMLILAGVAAWLPTLVGRSYDLPPPDVGRVLGLGMLVCSTIGLIIAGRIIDRAETRQGLLGVTIVGLWLTVTFWIVGSVAQLAPNFSLYLVAFCGSLLVGQGPNPALAAILSRITPRDLMGKITAIQILLVALVSQTTGPTIVAVLSETVFFRAGNWSLAYALSCVIFFGGLSCACSMALLLRQVRRLPVSAPAEA